MRVLFLDDDEERIEQFQDRVLRDWQVDVARTAQQTIHLLSTNTYDWVFLDHDLGGTAWNDTRDPNSGSEVVRWMVKNKPSIKVVVIHSWNTPAATRMQTLLRQAGYDVLRMPFGYDYERFENLR